MITAQHFDTAKKALLTAFAVCLAAYVFVILLTYTANDPSWSHISSDMGTVSNMGGQTGAWIADLLYTFIGWSAWWVIVFVAYEAICLWWQREQAFGFFRIVAYFFLVLATSGVVALFPTIFLHAGEWTGSNNGGILGYELGYRLSRLLTTYGAGLFFFLFAILTATFAFDIRWKEVANTIFSLSWLGNGVRDSKQDDIQTNEASAVVKEEVDGEILNETHSGSPIFEQLALELTKSTDSIEDDRKHEADPDPSLSNVLNEFLINSGLGETILSLKQQEAEEARLKAQQQSELEAKKSDIPVKKEPSFAWNDQNAIDELLDKQKLANVEAKQQYVDDNNLEPEIPEANSSDVDILETNSLSANESSIIKQDVEQVIPVEKVIHPIDVIENIENIDTATNDQNDNVEDSYEQTNSAYADTVVEMAISSVSHSQPSMEAVDLTPTNTPPANPTKPHEESSGNTDKVKTAPTIRFAVPEGDLSNHIEDMVQNDEDTADNLDDDISYVNTSSKRDDIVLAGLDDDAAYAQSSRAMQTAKYRSNLTPLPELSILDKPDPDRKPSYTQQELTQLSELLEIKLQEFNVKAEVVNAIPGPVVTRFEVELAAGVKASKVTGISRDLARSLSMASLRVVEVIPGKPYIGIEVPNKKREMVRLIELLDTEQYKDPKAQISMAMGKDIGGKPIITDLARAPHMLVAGTTGSGKSVLVNSMLLSMLLKYKPDELRLILIDPKQLELANYNDIPHLLTPVVTDMNEAASSLSWCVAEMERRYQLMSLLKVRKLGEFNKKVLNAEKAGTPILDPLWRPNGSVSIDKAPKLKTLPMIVIVADEFADMIMQVGKQAEELITRLAQKSRAAGIHLMLATQRPSVDVITGLIKANIPVRAALRVNSKVDSRTILDAGGAEDMLGNGDMLFLGPGQIEPERVHGAYVSDAEVNRVCDAWRERGAPDYIDNMASNFELTSPSSSGGNSSGEDDALYDEAVAFVMETRKVSASSIQRKFSIGYNRAARIVDSMEEAGLVSSMGKSGKRELLM